MGKSQHTCSEVLQNLDALRHKDEQIKKIKKENKERIKNYQLDKREISSLPVTIISKVNHIHYLAFVTFKQVR